MNPKDRIKQLEKKQLEDHKQIIALVHMIGILRDKGRITQKDIDKCHEIADTSTL